VLFYYAGGLPVCRRVSKSTMRPNCDARYDLPTELPLKARTRDNISKQ